MPLHPKDEQMPKDKTIPTAVKRDSRTCFGISWFTSEEDATAYSDAVRAAGRTYNGGFMHGLPLGRDRTWDYVDADLGPLFASTD